MICPSLWGVPSRHPWTGQIQPVEVSGMDSYKQTVRSKVQPCPVNGSEIYAPLALREAHSYIYLIKHYQRIDTVSFSAGSVTYPYGYSI